MTDGLDADVTGTGDATDSRDEVVEQVREHAGTIARELALLQGGDYGHRSFDTDAAEWTVKYEGGALEYLRFSPKSGSDVYVISTKQPPEPEDLVRAMDDYDAFVESFNTHVDSLDGVLDDVSLDFPSVASTETVVAERDRIVTRIREVADEIAGQLHRYDGTDYGTFTRSVDGRRWELKREGARVSYLRVGGEGGVYLLSQYEPPSAPEVREYAPAFEGFVRAYNEYVDKLEADLAGVSLDAESD
ncbi:hypothetical protein [Haloarchaeobius sp. TZWWS8]|uniref:hypothetical protein n=1 Tax=Haloarchaeobius sp. TZWWS8 TaxID=3446121 RepID=UPI003EB8A832